MNACPQHRTDLALLAANVLEQPARDPLERHAAECPGCRNLLAELRAIGRAHTAAMSHTPPIDVPPDFHQRLLRRLSPEPTTPRRRRAGWFSSGWSVYRWPLVLPVSLAAVAGLAWILGPVRSPVEKPTSHPLPVPGTMGRNPAWDAPATLLTYRRAASQSADAFDALLTQETAHSPGTDSLVTAFRRDLPNLTD